MPATRNNTGQSGVEPTAAAPAIAIARRSPHAAQAILLAGALAQLGLALLITIYLARVLSAAAFGFFSLVGSIFILTRKALDLGLSNVAARDIAGDPTRERPIIEGLMAYRRVAGAAMALAVVGFALTQQTAAEQWVLVAVAAVLLFTEPAAFDPVFQVRQAQGAPTLLNLFAAALVLGGSVVFKRMAIAGPAFALLLVMRETLTLLVTNILGQRLLGYRLKPGFRGRALKAFLGPAIIFGLASLIYAVYFNCDVFFVYALRGKEELGAYAAAFRPINPLMLLPWLLMVPMVPVLTALAVRDRQLYVRQVRNLCGLALGIGGCAVAAGALLAPDLVRLLYGGRYLEGALSSVAAFRWLAVALGLVSVTTVLTASLLADRKEKLLLAIGTAALVANVALNVVLLRRYNFTAAAFATAMTELLFFVAAVITFQMVTGRSAIVWNAVAYAFPAMLVALVLRFTPGGAAFRVSCGVALGGLSVAALLLSPEARRFRKEAAEGMPTFDIPRIRE